MQRPNAVSAQRATIPAVRGIQAMLGARSRLQNDTWFGAALYSSAALFALLVLLVPAYLLLQTAGAADDAMQTMARPATLRVLLNTVGLTSAVTLASTVIAVPLAWITTRSDLPGRRLWSIIHALPLVMPSYIYAFLFLSVLSPKGLVQQWLAPLGVTELPPIYGFGGAFIVLTLIGYPYIYLTVQASLRQFDPTLLEVAQSYGASKRQIVQHVLLPYLWPSITSGGLLVALYCLRDFGAVTLLQFSTFTRVIYNRYTGFRLQEAATLALVLVLMTGIIMLFEARLRSAEPEAADEVADSGSRLKQFKLQQWRIPALLFSTTVSFFALIMPTGVLVYWFVRGLRQDWLVNTIDSVQRNTSTLAELIEPAQLSLLTALPAALVAALLAVPIAILATRFRGPLARLIERISYASYALPGIVVALAFVYAGINFVRPLYQTLPMLIAAYLVLFVPQAVSAERSTLKNIPVELEEVGHVMGGSSFDIFRYVTLPLMRPGIIAGGLLVFLTVMKELPATLILSPIGYRTLPVLVWSNISEAFFARAAIPTLLLLLLSSVPLALLTARDSRS